MPGPFESLIEGPPDWAAGSNAYDPSRIPHAAEWVRVAAKHNLVPPDLKLFSDKYSETHVAIGPAISEVREFLYEALGRRPEPYRTGWLVTTTESSWLGFVENEQSVTIRELVRRGQHAV